VPRLSSDLQDAGVYTLIPNGRYNAHVIAVRDTDRNDISKPLTSQGGAPMVQLDWEIDEGEYAKRQIRFDTLMLGGNSKEGKPISLGALCSFLHFTGTPWSCMDCNNTEASRKFYLGDIADNTIGLKKGNFYCPDCKSPKPRITYDTGNFMGARCGVGVASRKGNDDREFNNIKGYTDLT